MKNESKIIIYDKNDKKKEYDLLLTCQNKDYEYILYTNHRKNKDNEEIIYLSKCEINNKKAHLESVTDESELVIFNKLLKILNKNEGTNNEKEN